MNYLHSYHTVTDTGKNQRAKMIQTLCLGSKILFNLMTIGEYGKQQYKK